MKDSFGRTIEYMRISVTDRCNLRCRYCMPDGIELVPMDRILSYEDIVKVVRVAASLGITRFKITGGEPLVRKGITKLIGMMKNTENVEQVSLTTNGVLLPEYIDELYSLNIDGINISLDTLDSDTYGKITGVYALEKVLDGIDKSLEYGIKTKINSVVLKDMPIDNYVALSELAKDRKLDVRFIEMMPIGAGREYESVDCRKIIEALFTKYPDMENDYQIHGNGPARYYKPTGFTGSIGIINAVHDRFCDSCNRIRLTSTGELKPCLCYGDTINLKDIKTDLTEAIKKAVMSKPCGHDFAAGDISERRNMSQIGG